jgi:hypothetical protein
MRNYGNGKIYKIACGTTGIVFECYLKVLLFAIDAPGKVVVECDRWRRRRLRPASSMMSHLSNLRCYLLCAQARHID